MFKALPLFLALLLITEISIAQTVHSSSNSESDTISIELTEYNNIAIKAILNDIDTLTLMLHTAVNDVSLTKTATAKMSSIQFSSADSVKSWGGESESRNSENNFLQIADLYWKNVSIWESKHSGHNTDGKFGLNLFGNKIVELNFEKEYMIIHSNLPENLESYHKVNIINENGLIFIEGDCQIENEVYSNKFLVHSGYSGSILLDDDFVSQNSVSEKVDIISESTLKDSYGNELKTINAILPYFHLGGIEFSDVPVGFFEGSINRQRMSVLGGDILKRFNVIFDLKDSSIFLQPNKYLGMPYSTK